MLATPWEYTTVGARDSDPIAETTAFGPTNKGPRLAGSSTAPRLTVNLGCWMVTILGAPRHRGDGVTGSRRLLDHVVADRSNLAHLALAGGD
jgi:hypothetical protein